MPHNSATKKPASETVEHSSPVLIREPVLWLIGLVLLIPALFINLGVLPANFHTDESRRALVALEMILSGDYLTPTLNGELYLNKPPLYNWIIAGFFNLFNEYSPLILRLPVVLSLMLYGLIAYWFVSRNVDRRTGVMAGFATITCGRFLFYDSYIGLIDTTFSLLTYTGWMLMYHFYKRDKWYALFLVSYFLTAIGFLIKGLPSVVFQGITLLTLFTYQQKFRKLFSLPHILGGLLFLGVVGLYYWAYFRQNNISGEDVFGTLWNESAKRTPVAYGWQDTVRHFVTFPFEIMYHYAPWTLLVLFLFKKGVWRQLKSQPFIWYNVNILFFNILIYWLSPQVYARYLLMFLPLMFTIGAYVYYRFSTEGDWQRRLLDYLLMAFVGFLILAFAGTNFYEPTRHMPYVLLQSLLVVTGLALLLYVHRREKTYRLIIFVLVLLVTRIGFNWFVLPNRLPNLLPSHQAALRVAEITKGQPLRITRELATEGTAFHLHDHYSYTISAERKDVLRVEKGAFQPGTFYIVGEPDLASRKYREYYRFENKAKVMLYLVQFE